MLCELQNIRYRFASKGQKIAFELSELAIKKGEHSLILGSSGCGKSTLLNLMAASLTPHEGQIEILGQDLSKLTALQKDSFRAEHMGIIFQQFNLLPFADVYTNIALALRFSALRRKKLDDVKEEIKKILNKLQLDEEAILYKKAGQLSVGQQQRVAAARALLGSPPLILADEPTSALDDEATSSFIQLIFDIASSQGSTIIMVSHNKGLKKYFEKIVNLEHIGGIRPC